MARYLLFLLPFMYGCNTSRTATREPTTERPAGVILTIIFKIDPKLDTLTVFDIIRGPGSLRTDYPATTEAGPKELLFTFLDAGGRALRQTAKPYPGPNRYESPGDDGRVDSTELLEEARSLVLKTQASRRLRWLSVVGELLDGTAINQRIDLKARK